MRSPQLVALVLSVLCLPVLCLPAGPARGELYRWVDARGNVHITDDLSRVPPEQRADAARAAREADAPSRRVGPSAPSPVWQRPEAQETSAEAQETSAEAQETSAEAQETSAEAQETSAPAAASPSGAPGGAEAPRRHVLRVERAGLEMRVTAELDNGARVPFIVDTGAQLNTVPAWALAELGVEVDDDTPRTVVSGISGRPMLVPVITVGSLRIGTAEVEDVELAVLPTRQYGLLGMPYFNHFKIETDPSRGTLTLIEIDLDAVEGVYGGRNERAWRSKFQLIQHMLQTVRTYLDQLPPEFVELQEELEQVEDYWLGQLDDLELRASRAGVPRAWRE